MPNGLVSTADRRQWQAGHVIVHGLLLAAGAGRRYGAPKALVDGWLDHSLAALAEGGCADRTVVLGAAAEQVRALVPEGVDVIVADDWADGMGASLRAGLAALADSDAVLVSLVDLPDVGPEVVRRLVDRAVDRSALARATYGGRPGHPVLLGHDHLAGAAASALGDTGARDYLAAHEAALVECGDLATGRDVDVR
jgi:CTP:molybdopterin cytidylyltransferase MocA